MITNAVIIRDLHSRMKVAFAQRPHGAEHSAACAEFHARYDALAFPGGLQRGLKLVADHDPVSIDVAVAFLFIRPNFYRSGYIQEELAKHLKRAPLTNDQQKRLAQVVLRSVTSGPRRLAAACARLAPAIDSAALLRGLDAHINSADPEIARRAARVATLLTRTAKR